MEEVFFDTVSKLGTPGVYRYMSRHARCSPVDRLALDSACDAYEALSDNSENEALHLSHIAVAAKHPRKVVWEIALLMLSQLAKDHASAREHLWLMARSGNANIRIRSFANLTDLFPRDFCVDLIHSAINDKSDNVGHAASWQAVDLDLRELASAVRVRESAMKKGDARPEMRMLADLLDHQYHEYHNENGYNLVLAFPDLFPNRVVWPGDVREGEIEEYGLEAVVSRVRSSNPAISTLRRSWLWVR